MITNIYWSMVEQRNNRYILRFNDVLFNVRTNWVMVSVAYCGSGNILRPLAGRDLLLHCDCFLNDIGGAWGERRSKHFCYHLLVRSSQPQPSITLLIIEAGFIAQSTITVVKRGRMKERLPCDIDKTHIVILFFFLSSGILWRRKETDRQVEKDVVVESPKASCYECLIGTLKRKHSRG